MGVFKKLKEKLNQRFTYVINKQILRIYLENEMKFSLDNNLEASADLYIYINGEKHQIQIWNFGASRDSEEKEKGLIVFFDDNEYRTIDDMISSELRYLPEYFKIELINCDDFMLNKYKEEHPELRLEDY